MDGSVLIGDVIEIESSNFLVILSKHILECMKTNKYTDIGFTPNNKRYKGHRLILSVASDLFTDRSKEQEVTEILKNFNDQVITALFEFLYTGKIRIDVDNLDDFVELSKLLKIHDVQNVLSQFIDHTVDVGKCLKILRLSTIVSANSYNIALDLALENFMSLFRSPDFYRLKNTTLAYILRSDDLNVPSEEDVFFALKLWIEQNVDERRKYLPDLINCVRLQYLSIEFLTKTVLTYCAICPECVVTITGAMQSILSSNPNTKANPRKSTAALIAVGSWDDGSRNYIETYDPSRKIWKKSKDYEFNRRNFSAVQFDQTLMIIGGHSRGRSDSSNQVDLINLKTGEKTATSSMHEARYNAAAVVINRTKVSDVYVIGGTGTKVLGTVERWSSISKVWRNNLAQLPQRMHAHSAAVLDGKIYVTGGHKKKVGTFSEVLMYTPQLNNWLYRAPMKHSRHAHSSAAINGKLYVAGGCLEYGKFDTYISNVEWYDPKSNTWTELCLLPSPRTVPGICLYRDKIVCVGGNSATGLLNDVVEYDKSIKKWNNLAPLNLPREGSFLFVLPTDVKIL